MLELYNITSEKELERLLKSQLPKKIADIITIFDLKIVRYNRIELWIETYDYHGSWGWTFDNENMVSELRYCLRSWRKSLRHDLTKYCTNFKHCKEQRI